MAHANLQQRAAIVAVTALFGAALLLRVYELGRLPGVNGDEGWWAYLGLKRLAGDWSHHQTPNGRPATPFFPGTHALVHLVLRPSFVVMRLAPLTTGIALVVLTWVLLRRVMTPVAALLLTMLMAAMPVNIEYSRLAFEHSQSALCVLFTFFFALRGRWWPAGFAFVIGLVTHPTNFLIAPVLIGMAIGEHWHAIRRNRARFIGIAAALSCVVALVAGVLAYLNWHLVSGNLPVIPRRAASPLAFLAFATRCAQFFSGSCTYRYITGDGTGLLHKVLDNLVPALAAAPGFVLWRTKRWSSVRSRDWGIAAGLGVALLSFYLIGGPLAFRPNCDRYGLFAIVPAGYVVVCGYEAAGLLKKRAAALTAAATVLLIWCGTFASGYFVYLYETGGTNEDSFQTGRVEPKVAVLEIVRRDLEAQGVPVTEGTIIAETFWLYWGLKYLTYGGDQPRVIYQPIGQEVPVSRALLEPDPPPTHYRYRATIAREPARPASQTWIVTAYPNRPFVRVTREYGDTLDGGLSPTQESIAPGQIPR